jgi:hypothetical protein
VGKAGQLWSIKMTTYAQINNGIASEVVTSNPFTIFHPDVAVQFSIVPDGTETGAILTNGVWTNAAPFIPPTPVTPPLSALTPMQFYLAFTPTERIAIKASVDVNVKEFWSTYELAAQLNEVIDPNLVSVKEALAYLAAPVSPGPGAGILASPGRITQILSGTPQ